MYISRTSPADGSAVRREGPGLPIALLVLVGACAGLPVDSDALTVPPTSEDSAIDSDEVCDLEAAPGTEACPMTECADPGVPMDEQVACCLAERSYPDVAVEEALCLAQVYGLPVGLATCGVWTEQTIYPDEWMVASLVEDPCENKGAAVHSLVYVHKLTGEYGGRGASITDVRDPNCP